MRKAFTKIMGIFSGSRPARGVSVRARYDAAQTTDENRRHWSAADALSANAANSPSVRDTLRRRARYECANNSYLNGLVKTLAYDFIGSGPRLQLNIEPADRARIVERNFSAWLRNAGIVDKLRIMHEARIRDGESFAIIVNNPRIRGPIKLDIRLIEAEQVASPYSSTIEDGIEYDSNGNPISYVVLDEHPGGESAGFKAKAIAAEKVLHWYRVDRPGQGRGVTELQSALESSAILRRYTKATLNAAEFAANIAGVLKTDQAPGSPIVEGDEWERIEWERGAMLTLPPGYDITQVDAKHPNSGYAEFKKEILNEIGRCVLAPLNVVSGNSSGYNYSSGRLDHQLYHQPIWTERERFDYQILSRIVLAWSEEAALIPGMIPDGLPPYGEWMPTFNWDGFPSPDPLKDANATTARLSIGVTTLAEECARDGKDWREVLQQIKAERDYAEQLGITLNPESMPQETEPEPEPEMEQDEEEAIA